MSSIHLQKEGSRIDSKCHVKSKTFEALSEDLTITVAIQHFAGGHV